MKKTVIDEEIKNLKNKIYSNEITIIPSKEIRELQSVTLAVHAYIETWLEIILSVKIADELARINISYIRGNPLGTSIFPARIITKTWFNLMNEFSFRNKLKVAVDNKEIINCLKKVNSYRNEFAHWKERGVKEQYNYKNPKGKQKIRDLLRCLVAGCEKIEKYASVNKFF